MGKLALWGAVGGLGKGASQYGAHVLSEASKDADAKRAARLEQLRQKHRAELQGRDHENSLAQIHARGGVQAGLQEDQQAHQVDMQGSRQAHDVDMQAGGHENTLEQIEARGDTQIRVGQALAPPAAAGGDAGGMPARLKPSERKEIMETTTLKTSTFADGILQKETETPAVVLKEVGFTLVPVSATLYHRGRLTGDKETKEQVFDAAEKNFARLDPETGMTLRQDIIDEAAYIAQSEGRDAYNSYLRELNTKFNGFFPSEVISMYGDLVR